MAIDEDPHFGPGAPADLNFDFAEYFRKVREENTSEQEQDEFNMRVLANFCSGYLSGGDPASVPAWITKYLAEQFLKVLVGESWNNAFPLPWHGADQFRTRAEQNGLEMYCMVENLEQNNVKLKKADRLTKVEILTIVAEKFNVEYVTTRGAYYKLKKELSKSSDE